MNNLSKSINYFNSLIDPQGIIQFTNGRAKALEYGYAIEDQARGLLVALQTRNELLIDQLVNLILNCQRFSGGVKMLWNKDGHFLEKHDDFGEASAEVLWVLGVYQSAIPNRQNISNLPNFIAYLIQGLSQASEPRVIGYSLLGLYELKDEKTTKLLADRLVALFNQYSAPDWPWFENLMTYANALMPWGLLKAYQLTGKKEYQSVAVKSFQFLLDNLKRDEVPVVVGNIGWWPKGKEMPLFDEQPIDLAYLVLACLDFYEETRDKLYLEKAKFFYSWFEGHNLKKAKMIREDGGCCDGLNEDGPNSNAGAESIICYLLAALKLSSVNQ